MKSSILLSLALLAVSVLASPAAQRASYPWEHADKPGVYPGHSVHKHSKKCHHKQHHGSGNGGNGGNSGNGQGNSTTGYPPSFPDRPPYSGQPGEPYVPGKVPPPYTRPTLPNKPLPNDNKPWNVTIIHTNDIHAHMDQFNKYGTDCTQADIDKNNCFGGVARITTVVNDLRKQHPNSYLMDAGDQFQGTLFYNYYKGNTSVAYMNALGYDVMTVGNHEFDDKSRHLADFISQLNFPVISSNMKINVPELAKVVHPYTVLTKYGSRLGVIGFITNTTGDITSVGNEVTFLNPIDTVQATVDHLRNDLNVDRIIAVSHNGYFDDIWLAQRTRGLSLIVGGHSHSLLLKNLTAPGVVGPYPTAVTNLDGNTTYVVQAKAWGQYVGVVDVEFNADSTLKTINGDPILLDKAVAKDAKVDAEVQAWRKPFDALAKTVIGKATVDLPNTGCTGGPCPLANLITDSFMPYVPPTTLIPLVLINGGGIRAGLSAGDITLGEVMTVLPFANFLTTQQVKGQLILDTLEDIATNVNKQQGGKPVGSFGHWSGLTYTLNRKGATPAERVSDVQVVNPNNNKQLEPLKADGDYLLVSIDFVMTGGDSILPTKFANLPAGALMSDMAVDYIKKLGTVGKYDDVRVKVVG
ncbi:hypothetical protein RI367_007058 [Sorochytrium milnesiophthora]